jgi:predicted TIM-barrel fold metal-dependent hydrolase
MKTMDYHHHIIPRNVARLLPGLVRPDQVWDLEKSIAFMDNNNIRAAVLSLYLEKPLSSAKSIRVKAARAYNEAAAEAVKKYPGRFKAFSAVPFPYIDESVSEIKYALDTLKLDGVSFSPITEEVQLDNEICLPVLRELNKRRAAVFLHPANSEGIPVENERYLDAVLGFTRLLYYDRLKDHVNIRFILGHTGGIIPYLSENIGLLAYFQAEKNKTGTFMWDYIVKKKLAGEVTQKSLYIDMSDCFDETAFKSQQEYFYKGHLLWGSDSINSYENIKKLNENRELFNTDAVLF